MKKLISDLQNLGVQKGDSLLVHSSFKSFGKVDGGPETVTSSLLKTIGENGTLLVPALSYESVTENQTIFKVNHSPSCVGAFSEFFRQRPGTLRSLHPTHSIAVYGNKAEFFVRDHEKDTTPVGQHSPLSKLKDEHGKILFIGCGLKPNTSMHGIEEKVIPEYLYNGKVTFSVEDAGGIQNKYTHTTHGFEGWVQRYDRIENILNIHELKKGKLLEASCFLMDAEALWTKALIKLKQHPLYFVDKK